ncbi:extracellular solute-binding protein [Populibacterium corticicola]|uniref:Extracellular solute-binding protein n=1 Tax=Populibacterium corticicola TaxID=1812826 RepID=A0ABW5XG59_9MICO
MKLARLVALGAAAALALTGCSDAEAPEENPSSTETTATDDAQIGGSVTVWLAGETDTPETAVELLKEQAKANHGIDVNVERIGWGDLLPRVQTSIGDASTTPDIVELGNTQVPAFAAAGAFSDITGLWDELGGTDLGLPGFVDGGTYDNKLVAAPYYSGSRVVFYNTDDVKEIPANLDELNTLAAELNKDGHSGFYLGGQDWRNGISWIYANGGDIAKLEGDQWVGTLSSPESIKGLEQLQELYTNGTKAAKDATDADTWVPFNEGNASMFIAPGWAAGLIEIDNFSAFALPGNDGNPAPVFLGGSNIGISAKSPNQEAAQAVLKIMLGEEYQNILAVAGLGTIYPQHAELAAGDPVKEASVASATNGKVTPASPKWASFEETKKMEEFFFEIAQGGDVKEIAAKYDAVLNDALN